MKAAAGQLSEADIAEVGTFMVPEEEDLSAMLAMN
jgi:hypothetical protein